MSTTSPASTATSVPLPIAMPTSACASAGASLTPSPTMATTAPATCSRRTSATFPSGSTPATTRSTPAAAPMALAVRSLSPVSITTESPKPCRRSIACRELARMGSDTATRPASIPSTATYTGVLPCAESSAACGASGATEMPPSCRKAALPTASVFDATTPCAPRPVMEWKRSGVVSTRPRAVAARTIASASGCSLERSSDAVHCRRSSSATGDVGTITRSVTSGFPSVTVPVLSSTTVVRSPARCSASPPLISTPSSAPLPLATITAVGTARPMAQGQAMISTATAAAKARTSGASVAATYHTPKVTLAISMTAGTKTALIRSARC